MFFFGDSFQHYRLGRVWIHSRLPFDIPPPSATPFGGGGLAGENVPPSQAGSLGLDSWPEPGTNPGLGSFHFSPLARYPLEGGRPKGGGTIPAQIKQQNDFNKLDKHNILCYNNNRIGLLTILLLVRLSEQTVD